MSKILSQRPKVDFENNILMDYDREWFILTTLYLPDVCMQVFQGEYEFGSYRSIEQNTYGLSLVIAYILIIYNCCSP